jgi:hypothetical protein
MKTIGSWGCLLTVYNIMARYWNLCNDTPDEYLARMKAAGAMSGPYLLPAALRTAHPNQVAYDGFLPRTDANMRPKIRQWLNEGKPVPARVDFNPGTSQWDQHWVLLIGWYGEEFYMADPWHGDIALVSSRYNITGSDIIEAIFYRLS